MAETIQQFVIDDPKSYKGKRYRYHVGAVSVGFWGNPVFHSIIVIMPIQILHDEDVKYLRDKLKEIKKVKKLGILAFSPLQE